jgi:tRNA threonylcarbamoyladenosine biosynthesis protein TsaB
VFVLAIETATDLAGVALAADTGVLASQSDRRGRRHGETVAPFISEVLGRAGVAPAQLDALCVDVGPGLFTGLRVGLSTAEAMGMALSIPVVTMTSLEALAIGAARSSATGGTQPQTYASVVDARRGEVFAQLFTVKGASVTQQGPEMRLAPEMLAGEMARLEGTVLCVGDGARRHRHLLEQDGRVAVAGDELSHPDPEVLASVGVERALCGAAVPALEVRAHYLRDADVRINWEHRR